MAGSEYYITFGGDTAALEASLATVKASIASLTRELATLAREQAATGASADSDLGQRMLAVAQRLTEARAAATGLKGELGGVGAGAKEGMGQAAEALASVRESLLHIAEIAGVAFSIEAVKDWIAATTEGAEKIEQIAAKLGASPEAVQTLGAEAKLAGADFEEMQTQMERLQLSLAKTGEKASPAAAALKALGIDVAEFRGATMTGQLELLSAAVSRYGDGAGKTAAMQALLGRSGADMIPFLDRGKAGMDELREAVERTGVVMSGATVAALAETSLHIKEMITAGQALSQKIYAAVNPAIDAAAKEMRRLIESMSVSGIRAGIESLTAASIDMAASIESFAVRADASLGGLFNTLSKLGAAMNQTPGELNKNAILGFFDLIGGKEGGEDTGAAAAAATTLSDRLAAIAKAAEDAKTKMHELYASGAEGPSAEALDKLRQAMGGAPKPQVPQMNVGGANDRALEETRRAAEAEASAEIDADKRVATEKEKSLDELLKTHQIGMAQWLAGTVAALSQESAAVKTTYDKELASAGLTSAEIVTIKKREADALADIAQKVRDAEYKAAEDSAQKWKEMADTVAGLMNSQVNALLRGTETIRQALKNMAASAIEDEIKWSVKAIAEDGARVAAHLSGNATIAASDQATGAAGALSWIESALKSIAASAAETFAGVTGFMAPLVGPAAPAFGAAAMGTVTAVEGMLYDTGAWSLPQDMLIGAHKGEMVIPQRGGVADEFRSFMANGGFGGGQGAGARISPVTNVNIHAMDSATVASTMMGNGGAILKAIERAARSGAHHGLRGLR